MSLTVDLSTHRTLDVDLTDQCSLVVLLTVVTKGVNSFSKRPRLSYISFLLHKNTNIADVGIC